MGKNIHLHWYRNDLRVHDQPYYKFLEKTDYFIPVFIIDPRWFKNTPFGFRKISLKRWEWIKQSLIDLKKNLKLLGSELLILYGYPEKILPKIQEETGCAISYQREYATEEFRIELALQQRIAKEHLCGYHGGFLIEPMEFSEHLPNAALSFSKYRKLMEKKLKNKSLELINLNAPFPKSIHLKSIKPLEIKSRKIKFAFDLFPGETSALEHLNNYLFSDKKVLTYKKTRNESLGKDFSSKLSFYLNHGSISPKWVYNQIKKFEKEVHKNESTYWLVFELLWRDFFRINGWRFGKKLFLKTGITGTPPLIEFDNQKVKNWMEANTDSNWINAHLQELLRTGFMSNRGRQNVASYFIHDLKQDWRIGAAFFERHLLDYDVYSNYGNWLYIAGMGSDKNGPHIFDVDWQQKHYDPEKNHQYYWLGHRH